MSEIPNEVGVEVLEARLERLEDTWREFCNNQNELFKFHSEEGYGDPEVDFEATETKYIATKSALVKAIRKRLPARDEAKTVSTDNLIKEQSALLEKLLEKPATSASDPKSNVELELELPQFKLPPFSGDYREWPGFRDMFLGSIDRYLKSLLRDDAAKLLNHVEISDSNYLPAWEKLEHRYDKPLCIINAYIESYLKIPTVTVANATHLRKLVDNADEVVRGLKALQSESKDPWLIYLLLNKTDIETRKAWALENRSSEDSTIQELLEFLEDRCDALEASESKNRVIRNVPRSANISNNIKSFTVSKSSCPKCNENHLLPQCSQFLTMSIPSRRNFVRDQKLCYNCLGTKHSSSQCRVKSRCSHCHTRHHTLVHLENLKRTASEANLVETPITEHSSSATSNSLTIVSNHVHNDARPYGLLPTDVVNVIDATGKSQLCRLLLDTGSQVSFVTESCVKRLGLRRRNGRLLISGISSLEAGVTHGVVTLSLHSRFDSNEIEVEAYILTKITSQTPILPFEFNNPLLLKDLQLANSGFNTPGPIDILLGSDKAWSILRDGHRMDVQGRLIAHNTVFGWVISGNITDEEVVSLHVGVDNDLDVLLRSFWEIEEFPNNLSTLKNEDLVDAHFSNNFSRAPDSKYIVELPFRQSDVNFGNTISGAISRLLAMERRFSRCEGLRLEYCKFMKIYQELGHMERIPENLIEPTSGKVFYLPHHAVITNKIRVVFDGSHKDANGLSLNEMLYVGPPLQRNLINVCMRFRLHKYVFCADIIKMFRQIWVNVKHRDFQRIVWRESPDDPIAHFRLSTVTYGTSPAPFLAMRVLRQLALDYQHQYPIASHSILHDFYVDDILTGADSVSEVIKLKEQLIELLSCAGLQLSKWSSNCWSILNGTDCNQTFSLDLDCANNLKKVLGLVWNPYRDIFTFKISSNQKLSPTKRNLLSEVAKIFDPLGFLAPSTILLKMLFQELWVRKAKIGWDDSLPAEVAEKWNSYKKDLPCFENIEILRRCIFNCKYFDLVGFSDASEKAYSAVVYARSISEDGVIQIHLVAAKTRVAPVKQLTIPRLELCGALLLCRLIELIRSSLDIKPVNIFAFCDSQIVLAWLSSTPRKWNTFVANRTSEILDVLPRSAWNYIRSEENPADCASRGVEPKKLLDLEIWWKGPAWLPMDMTQWPIDSILELDGAPEGRKKPVAVNTSSPHRHFLYDLAKKISSWTRLVRIVAFVRRFVRNCRVSAGNRENGYLSYTELQLSKKTWLLWVQSVSELFSLIHQEFWVLGSRNLIRKIIHDCVKCFRLRQTTSSKLMGNLPSSRLSPSYAFAHTGCDYAGPITLRLSKGRKPKLTKGYFALFVCMATKALHLEVVSDLSTDALLAALRRFIARRGKCSVIYSDNETNFQGAARILSEVYHLVRSKQHNETASTTLAEDNIRWEFIPPHSPHFGGLWEAGVKCVKQHLRRVLGNNILTFEEMSTLLAQIEALLNSRPLCAISDSDLNPLTPSHFIIGRPYTAIPEPSYLEVRPNHLGRWELIQNMMQGFWHQWHSDYLTSLQQRPKWRTTNRNFRVGDLVILKEPNLPPSKWLLGGVEEIHPGKDGHVRVVSVRTSSTVLKRPITKLAVLPCS